MLLFSLVAFLAGFFTQYARPAHPRASLPQTAYTVVKRHILIPLVQVFQGYDDSVRWGARPVVCSRCARLAILQPGPAAVVREHSMQRASTDDLPRSSQQTTLGGVPRSIQLSTSMPPLFFESGENILFCASRCTGCLTTMRNKSSRRR